MNESVVKYQAKSKEKLSSGFRINRAADDAAGLAISEKMRRQIRGLTQASLNCQDGVSMVQTAEGGMSEIHDMLQRMNELAVKAANGTLTTVDRSYIQSEVNEIVQEIDRVSETTVFNEKKLLKRDEDNPMMSKIAEKLQSAFGSYGTVSKMGEQIIISGDSASLTDMCNKFNTTDSDEQKALLAVSNMVKAASVENGLGQYTISPHMSSSGGSVTFNLSLALDSGVYIQAGAEPGLDNKIWIGIDDVSAKGLGIDGLFTTDFSGKTEKYTATTDPYTSGGFSVGGGTVSGGLSSVGGGSTEMTRLPAGVMSPKSAENCIEVIKNAMEIVSSKRSELGAKQNRLEHTIANLDNIVENTTAAESAIRDTDMAREMVIFSNQNIIAQVGQSMLAQANQQKQGVLSLLQ